MPSTSKRKPAARGRVAREGIAARPLLPSDPVAAWTHAVTRLALLALRALESATGTPVTPRKWVNHLRGNESGEPDSTSTGAADLAATRGVFACVEAGWLHELCERLVEGELAERSEERPSALHLSPEGRRAIEGDGPDPPDDVLPPRDALGANPALEERLGALRRRLAKEEGRPAFSVFDNATLARIARARPRDLSSLAEVRGLGERRLAKYGRRILGAVRRGS